MHSIMTLFVIKFLFDYFEVYSIGLNFYNSFPTDNRQDYCEGSWESHVLRCVINRTCFFVVLEKLFQALAEFESKLSHRSWNY